MFWWLSLAALIIVSAGIIVMMHKRHQHALAQVEEALQLATTERDHCLHQANLTTRYQQVVQHLIEDAILVINHDNVIIDCNATAQALSAHCRPGASLIAAFRLHELELLLRDTRNRSSQLPLQLTYNERLYRVTCQLLTDEKNHAALVMRDISELQRLGHARRDFIANISHELRTPLASIRLLVDSIQRHPLSNPDQQNMLGQISDQTDSLVQIAQEMFDLSLIESGRLPMRLKPTELREIADTVCTRLKTQATRNGLNLQNNISASVLALVDPVQLERVLTNLVHNAIKFTPSSTATVSNGITIGISDIRPPNTHSLGNNGYNPAEWLTLYVRDTGVGIPKYEQNRIFERFYKLDRVRNSGDKQHHGRSGTGLGLAISKHIVEAHGGQIWVNSAEGKGATFYLTVPTDC
ncbi:MAG: HAMP domain-containing histidine kinase [Anaerolineae bacterium]|nr:HAMP domain-containing histidine kinase [Anaerolineae bacterium]